MSWARMDSSWVRDGRLHWLRTGAATGASIAALKVLLTIGAHTHFDTCEAELSLADFELVTGLSRPQVIKGIRMLEGLHVISVRKTSHIHVYKLENAHEPPWSKVPTDKIRARLKHLPNRGETALAALKMLVLFLVLRDGSNNRATVSHEKIVIYTGIRTNHIRAGIDHLVNHEFVHVHLEEKFGRVTGRPTNSYELLARFDGGALVTLRPLQVEKLRAAEGKRVLAKPKPAPASSTAGLKPPFPRTKPLEREVF